MIHAGAAFAASLAGLAFALAGPALADPCRGKKTRPTKAVDCAPARKFEPYDPDRVRPGRTPGFVDLGNGTEVRVSGRVRMEYDLRR